jgi:capsular exopolysaccharide synthesis family protein
VELAIISRMFRTYWLCLPVFALVGVAVGLLVSLVMAPVYTSETKLLVSIQTVDAVTPSDLVNGNNFAVQKTITYLEVVPSERVLAPVIEDLGLDETPEELAQRVVATAAPNSVVLTVQASAPTPAEATDLAAAVSESFSDVVVNELETPVANGISPVKIDELQAATVPEDPSAPILPLNLALGLFAGLLIGAIAALLLALSDKKIRSVSDVERVIARPVLGAVARGRRTSRKRPHSIAIAEEFRSIRTNLSFVSSHGAGKTFLVASSIRGEGRTSTVVGLAKAFAEIGAHVVVIDADFQSPKLSTALGAAQPNGLVDALTGAPRMSMIMTESDYPGIDVIPSGTVTIDNPSRLLGGVSMKRLIDNLAPEYDVILIDAAPLLVAADAAMVSGLADGAIVIAGTGRVTSTQLESGIEVLTNLEVPIAGVIVTMAPKGRRREPRRQAPAPVPPTVPSIGSGVSEVFEFRGDESLAR